MTIPCANCGEPLPHDAHRCPICDALAPLPAPEADETELVPWAIPIREGTPRPPGPRDPMGPVTVAVLAIAALAVLVVIGANVLGGSGDEVADPPDAEVRGDTVGADTGSESSTSLTTTSSTSSSTTSTSSSTTTTSTTTTTTPTTSPPTTTAAPSAGSAPMLSSSFGGGWVAQLTSVPTSAGTDRVEAAWSRARTYASGAVVTASDDWSSLQGDYWVVVDPGPFSSPEAVAEYCESIGHADQSDCLPRELSGRR